MARLIKGRRAVSETPPSPDERIVRLEPADDPAAVAGELATASRVEVNFPKFGDGRGFSTARLLRERYGYKGELRAVGQITRDHLFFLESVGFDAYELREGENAEEAVAELREVHFDARSATDPFRYNGKIILRLQPQHLAFRRGRVRDDAPLFDQRCHRQQS